MASITREPNGRRRKQRLLVRDARRHHAHFDVRNPRELFRHPLQTPLQFFLFTDRLPLERRVRLRHKTVQRGDDFADVPETFARFEHAVFDAFDERDHLYQIFVGLRRQADHQVELDRSTSPVKDRAADVHDLVVRQILVDNFANRSEPVSGATAICWSRDSTSASSSSSSIWSSRRLETEMRKFISRKPCKISLISGWSQTAVETRPILSVRPRHSAAFASTSAQARRAAASS